MAKVKSPVKVQLLDDEAWRKDNEGTVAAAFSTTTQSSDVKMADAEMHSVA